jgi:hypothetical protein
MISQKFWLFGALMFAGVAAVAQQQYPDPRSFSFPESVIEPAAVIVNQPSTNTHPGHPRGTDDPLFLAQELLGRPTDTAITINAAAREDLEIFYEYGIEPGSYPERTPYLVFSAGESVHTLIEGLKPNTRYYYRMRYRGPGQESFAARTEYSFHTQRATGSSFTFVVEADPHMMRGNLPEAYKLSLNKMLADEPDFLIDLGDTFFTDPYVRGGRETSKEEVYGRVELLRSYFDLTTHSVPLFLVNGNHEGEWGSILDGTSTNLAVLNTLGRKEYFPNPEPNGFYTGGGAIEDFVGGRQAYYSWQWGDALFIALDPYWYDTEAFDSPPEWNSTLGREQYDWLKSTLENSSAKYTFVFSHHLIGGLNMRGQHRGGIETVKYFEMGGYNLDGSWGFDKERRDWDIPIHQLLVAHDATIWFHGHDHLYVQQELDGIVYQETPVPAIRGLTDKTESAKTYNYNNGTVVDGGGYLRVSVSPEEVKVDYVRTFLPEEEDENYQDGMIGHSYTIQAD